MATFLLSGLWHGANWTFVIPADATRPLERAGFR